MITESSIKQLKKDKHTLLEGYVTEFLFKKQFLNKRNVDFYSHGWWTGVLDGKRYLFFLQKELHQIDKQIVKILSNVYEYWKVTYEDGKWCFQNEIQQLSEAGFIQLHKLKQMQEPIKATTETTNESRQNKCIEFFKTNNILDEIAVERRFADDFLSLYFTAIINIDFFTKNAKGEYCVIELKYKTESYDNFFGLDTGEIELLTELRDNGFRTFYVILYKNRNNKDMPIFDYMDAENLEKAWYIHEFDKKDIVSYSIAPQKTSVDGKKKQSYGKVPKDTILKSLKIRLLM